MLVLLFCLRDNQEFSKYVKSSQFFSYHILLQLFLFLTCHYCIFLTFNFMLGYSWLTMLWQFLGHSEGTQPYACIYSLSNLLSIQAAHTLRVYCILNFVWWEKINKQTNKLCVCVCVCVCVCIFRKRGKIMQVIIQTLWYTIKWTVEWDSSENFFIMITKWSIYFPYYTISDCRICMYLCICTFEWKWSHFIFISGMQLLDCYSFSGNAIFFQINWQL